MTDAAVHTFAAEAMATAFHIDLAHPDAERARQAAQAAFAELNALEGRLSRYREDSDLSRLNRLKAGQTAIVSPDTFECLQLSLRAFDLSLGVFNIAYATGRPLPECIELLADGHTVRVRRAEPKLDAGGIGKGFALDLMARLLEKDWEMKAVRLRASVSTILALDPPPGDAGWGVAFGPPNSRVQLQLRRAALSGSGTAVKGKHIVDPRTGRPAENRLHAWALAPTGAFSDALSTAFMILKPDEIRRVLGKQAGLRAFIQAAADKPCEEIAAARA